MNKIKIFMKKDLLFSIKWLPVFIIGTVVMPIYGAGFSETIFTTPLIAMTASSILGVWVYLSAICSLEDNPETEGLLSSLPVAKPRRIFGRFAATLILVIGSVVLSAISFLMAGGSLFFCDLVWTTAIDMMLYGIFLYVYYKSGLQAAQGVPGALLLGGTLALKANVLKNFQLQAGYEYGALAAAIVIFALAAKYSTEEYTRN